MAGIVGLTELQHTGGNSAMTIDTSGNLTIKTGTTTVKGEGTATTNLQQGLTKTWVTIDGDATTPVAFDSFNVASVQDDAAGKYGITMTSAMANANYFSGSHSSHKQQSDDYDRYLCSTFAGGSIDARRTTTECKIGGHYVNAYNDTYVAGVDVSGDLA